jgi:hypothetical protein
MFKNLTNFTHKRSWKEAIGFYLAYLLIGFILGAVVGLGYYLVTGSNNHSSEYHLGTLVALIFVVTLSFVVINAKGAWKFGYVLLALLSGILGGFGGALLGLIPVAYLTTRENKKVLGETTPSQLI